MIAATRHDDHPRARPSAHRRIFANSLWRGVSIGLLVVLIGGIATWVSASPVKVGHVQAELVSEVRSVAPGQPFWAGVRLKLDDEWHVYWRNPGDAGLQPRLTWQLPDGFTVTDIQWPYPEKIVAPPLTSFGYSGDIILPVRIAPPSKLSGTTEVTLKVAVEWLVCREACIPGSTTVSLTLPTTESHSQPSPDWSQTFKDIRQRLPEATADWKTTATESPTEIYLTLTPPRGENPDFSDVFFFPYKKGLIENADPQTLAKTDNGYRLTIKRNPNQKQLPAELQGVLVGNTAGHGPGSKIALAISARVVPENSEPAAAATVSDSGSGLATLWRALLFAFLGGMILNLMPCVLPVLSLKVLGFVKQANEDRRKAVSHSLVFLAGVVFSFWILAGALLILQAGGAEIGWGFQLQSPTFVVILAGFIFLFGMNLLGVFEVGTSLTAVGNAASSRSGYGGSFLNGVTATVVATPCTAPFMGSALGFSLSQPAWVSVLVFTALALGMAAPYVALTAIPGLVRFVPKPGRWMETLKQIMGFLLLATVVWLAWVLGVQSGSTAVVGLLAGLLLLGAAAWTLGRWGTFNASRATRTIAYLATFALAAGGLAVGMIGAGLGSPQEATANGGTKSVAGVQWEAYSPQRVSELRNSGTPVLIDFTAAWCLSCQVNERVAFSSSEVRQRLNELGVVTMRADWTSRDDSITQALAQFGRNSVPLYVLYGGKEADEPIILPQILTPGIVLQALQRIET